MYSGTTLTRYSGRVLGAHQKLDRLARRQLTILLPRDLEFPTIRQILYFEGKNGPDGIKRKSPARDEPWHYFNPFEETDTELLDLIDEHHQTLAQQLRAGNMERAAFEAAWLAHAIVDGLTPAHHFPYEEEVDKLRKGAGNETRTTIKEKLIMHGDTKSELIMNNWRMWGTKGLMATHGSFELGYSTLIAPVTVITHLPTQEEIAQFEQEGLRQYFVKTAREIAVLNLFDDFYEKGWTLRLAYRARYKLTPLLVKTIALAWYSARMDAEKKT